MNHDNKDFNLVPKLFFPSEFVSGKGTKRIRLLLLKSLHSWALWCSHHSGSLTGQVLVMDEMVQQTTQTLPVVTELEY